MKLAGIVLVVLGALALAPTAENIGEPPSRMKDLVQSGEIDLRS